MGETGFGSSEAALPLPRIFGRLLLLKLIARGGMGDVYLAATTGIEGAERACVVKTVRRDHIHDGSFLARFLDEARVQSQLNHPGVAQVLEAATDENGEPFTVVEYVEGRSLADVRQRAVQLGARIGWAESCAIGIEMAQALAHVHERAGADGSPLGIVHRDLSPQNVMIGFAGEVKLIDFGTARGHNRRCHTVAGVVFAKPGYVAPEVARQQVGDGRIDLYALGIMLWEMCAGRRFLSGDAQKHLEDAAAGKVIVPKLADITDAPKELDEVIAKLTANEPDDRYASASMAATDLARLLSTAPSAKSGERSVRARTHALMKVLWPNEPARARSDFAKLLKEARGLRRDPVTPPVSSVVEKAAKHMGGGGSEDPSMLAGTPYRLGEKIGEGASGEVFEAEHIELGRRLALKVLSASHASAHDAIDRFRREARAIAKLNHPNLAHLYDFGKSLDGRVFLAMELLHGETLDKHLKALPNGAMPWRDAIRIAIEVTHALEAAHGAHLVHRDLKPANLFLAETESAPLELSTTTRKGDDAKVPRAKAYRVKLLDFGVAMALAEVAGGLDEKRQKGFAIFGTPEYMAPEQVAGESVDPRCDLYALGCVLYELVTGARVFEGASSVVVMGKQLRETPESPRARAPKAGIPVALEAVILRALAKAPVDRFASAVEMRAALNEALRGKSKATKPGRNAGAFALGATLVLGVAAISMGWRAAPRTEDAAALSAPTTNVLANPPLPSTQDEATVIKAQESAPVIAQAEMTDAGASENAAAALVVAVNDLPLDTDPKPKHASAEETSANLSASTLAARADHAKAEHESREQQLVAARALAKAHPSEARSLRAWANAAYRAGELREARRASETWVLHDGTAEPRLFLANVLDASGRRAEAKSLLEEWLQLHPDNVDARRMHARFGTPLPNDKKSQIAHR